MPRSHPKRPLQSQYIFLPRGFIRPVFDFHDDGAGFKGADGVPLADGDVQGDYLAAGREFDGLGAAVRLVIIILPHQPPAQANHGFRGEAVPVDRQRASGLNGIEHTLRLVFRGIMKVRLPAKPSPGR